MTQRILFFLLFIRFSSILYGQNSVSDSLAILFNHQMNVFPQEKIYIHTDKPYYITGESIWFRAYLADAATHIPTPVSRYVYVELINPLDSIVTRVKIRQEEGAYHGYLLIPDDAPEGDYTMRAYTTFMQSQDEHYYFTKTIRIGDPQARAVHVETQFSFESGRTVHTTFRFSNVSPSAPLVPKSARITVNGRKPVNLKIEDDGTAGVNFNLPENARKRIMLLEVVAVNTPYLQFIQIPAPDEDFDVSFYPEGGALLQDVYCKTAFKAMKSNGQPEEISGVIYDQAGTEVAEIRTEYLGMGSWTHFSEKGKNYYAVCQNNKGQSKRFELPSAVDHGYSLSVSQLRNNLYISVLKPEGTIQEDDLYLLAHTRGMVHFSSLWDHEKNTVSIQSDQFPSGVLHFILFGSGMNPVSERLVFINHPDQAKVSASPGQENYAARSLVKKTVTVTDSDGQPVDGNFSVSVTSDKEVTTDSTANILTHLLLSSDLRGNIENPAYYFQNKNASAWALDLLMRTQGWRRYNIAEMAQGHFSHPTSPIELGPEISGMVKSVLLGKPAEDVEVTVMSFKGGYFDHTFTDKDGRFYFRNGELPDSTRIMVSAVPKRGMTRMELIIDGETFPERNLSSVPTTIIDRMQFAKYAGKAELKYTYDGGIRVYQLSEVTISADRKPPRKSTFYSSPNASITEEQIDKMVLTNIRSLLMRLPGVMITGGNISIRGMGTPLLIVDDLPTDIAYIDMINPDDVAQIDVLKDAATTSVFGIRGANGVIALFTKNGNISKIASQPFHIKAIRPLGFQTPVEFYAPKYDMSVKQNAQVPDLRTTIHWQPIVSTDSPGVASFEFYTADESTSYTLIIEGLTGDGKIIRHEEKLWRKDE